MLLFEKIAYEKVIYFLLLIGFYEKLGQPLIKQPLMIILMGKMKIKFILEYCLMMASSLF